MIRAVVILVFVCAPAMAQEEIAPPEQMNIPTHVEELPRPPSASRKNPRSQDNAVSVRQVPPTVQTFHQPEYWNMQLGEALYLAMQNNPDILIQQIVPQLAQTEVTQAYKRFDPEVIANHHWSGVQQNLASNITTVGSGSNQQLTESYGQYTGRPDQIAISKNLQSGASVRAGFSTGYNRLSPTGAFNTLNPAWKSSTTLELTQPLARGRGKHIQLLPIRIAKAYVQTAEHDFQSIVLLLLRDVENAYWNLAFAHENLEVRRKNAIEARKTFEKELEKQAIGESSRPEVGEARLHYHHMIDLYHMRKTELLEDERAFREMLGLPGFDSRRIFVHLPEELPKINTDWEWSKAVMLETRPDLISQRWTTKSAHMQYQLARDKCKPELIFESRIGKSGLANRFDESLDRMLTDDDYYWMAGVSYVSDVYRCGAKAESRRAYLTWCQQQKVSDQLEFRAVHSLQNAYEKLYQKMDRVHQMTNLRAAASERLAAYKEKFELGELAIELYLRAQADDADKELQERSAKVELMQAIVHFEFVRGTLMNVRSVIIAPQAPQLSPAENPEGDLLTLPKPTLDRIRFDAPEFREMLNEASPEVQDWLLSPMPSLEPGSNAPGQ